nr:uncharacterized protein LOC123747366 isoform X1 [Procambarus clarkii]
MDAMDAIIRRDISSMDDTAEFITEFASHGRVARGNTQYTDTYDSFNSFESPTFSNNAPARGSHHYPGAGQRGYSATGGSVDLLQHGVHLNNSTINPRPDFPQQQEWSRHEQVPTASQEDNNPEQLRQSVGQLQRQRNVYRFQLQQVEMRQNTLQVHFQDHEEASNEFR